MRRAGISLVLALLLGCSKEEPPKPTPPPPPPVQVPPEPALPALAEVRFRDWSEVEEEQFLKLPDPAAAPDFKWDFTPGRRYGYDFSATLTQRIGVGAGYPKPASTAPEK